ncbi:c-type cytochrome [Hydrogenimonas sp.]
MRKTVMTVLAGLLIAGLSGCGEKKEEPGGTGQESAGGQIKVTPGAVKRETAQESSKENSGQFYYSYNEEKSSQPEEGKRRTTIDAYLNIRSPYERVMVTMMIKKLSRDFIIKCSPCHDDYANGVIGPSLLDKDGDFIFKRLEAFKSGEKKNVLMKELVSRIDDKELKSIAEEIAKFNRQIRELRKGQQ